MQFTRRLNQSKSQQVTNFITETNHMGRARVQNEELTRKSRGLIETARARTSTSLGFRSGTGKPFLTSSTSGPPKRGTTTARQVFSSTTAVDAGRAPEILRQALAALHHMATRRPWRPGRRCAERRAAERARWGRCVRLPARRVRCRGRRDLVRRWEVLRLILLRIG